MSKPDAGRPENRSDGVDLTKGEPEPAEPFDPYRFGKPDHPIPAEYAPPGYTGPTIPTAPTSPYGAHPGPSPNPFGNPPGTPYPSQPPSPQQYPAPGPYGYGPTPPPTPYGYGPTPPPYHGYPAPRTSSGKAIAGLVLGILSIVLCWLSLFDAVFVILGLIFSIIALGETKGGRMSGRGLAVAGLVCTIIGALLATVLTVLIVRAADKCGGFSNDNSDQWQTCVRDNLF
jgi:hypothetical protein